MQNVILHGHDKKNLDISEIFNLDHYELSRTAGYLFVLTFRQNDRTAESDTTIREAAGLSRFV